MTTTLRRSVLALGAMVATAAVLAGCVKSETPTASSGPATTLPQTLTRDLGPPARSDAVINYGITSDTNSYSPVTGQWTDYTAVQAVYDPLMAWNADGQAKPYLAESMTPNADFTVWTIKLRPGINFHNGEPCNAEAVKLNLEKLKGGLLTGAAAEPIDFAEVDGDLAVKVTMKRPWSTFPSILTGQGGMMAAPEMLNNSIDDHPVGTGPFTFVKWDKNSEFSVTRNDNYWRGNGTPYLKGINFRPVPNIQTRVSALDSGTLDIIQISTPGELLSLTDRARAGEVQMMTSAAGSTSEIFIAMNTVTEPFNDPTAREAVITGLDNEELATAAFSDAYPPAYGPFDEGSPFYISPQEAGYPKFDPNRAKELVAKYQADHGKPLEFNVLIPTSPEYAAIAETIQQRAKDVGITANIQKVEQGTLVASVLLGQYQATGFFEFGQPDLERSYHFFASEAKPPGQLSLNFTHLDDAELEAAVQEARTTDDPAKQKAAYATIQKRLAATMSFAFLVHQRTAVVYRNDIGGVDAATLPNGEKALPSSQPFVYQIFKKS